MAGAESILVVEDSPDVTAFVRQVLEERGFKVTEAATGWRALQLGANLEPDVLLLDWQLPDITGLDVLQALRAGRCSAPAVLMTGYGSEALAITALRLGVRDYLHKPFEAAELLQAVETALAEGRLRKERELLTSRLAQAEGQVASLRQRIAAAQKLLGKLVSLTNELRQGKGQNWPTLIQEMRKCILQIGEALAGPSKIK